MSAPKVWTQSDPLLRPVHPSSLPWYGIPAPPSASASASAAATVSVSLLNSGYLTGASYLLTTQREGQLRIPVYCALVEKGEEALLFDLGIRPDPENLAPPVQAALKMFDHTPLPAPTEQLQKGGYDMRKLTHAILSHAHFDHIGDLDTLPNAFPIHVGPGTLAHLGGGYPHNKQSAWPARWVEDHNLVELPSPPPSHVHPESESETGTETEAETKTNTEEWTGPTGTKQRWQKLACFENAVDWFGDGSFWVIDTPGHEKGHLAALARVTADPPSYVLLGGDIAHCQDLFLPIPPPLSTTSLAFPSGPHSPGAAPSDGSGDTRSPLPVVDGAPVLCSDARTLSLNVGQLTRMAMEDGVMVLLAHETEAEGVVPLWPGRVDGWKGEGWREAKQRGRCG